MAESDKLHMGKWALAGATLLEMFIHSSIKFACGTVLFLISRFLFGLTSLLLVILHAGAANAAIDGLTPATAFTEVGMARNVSSAGTYYFDLNGQTFSTYVTATGQLQIAIDFGNGVGNLPQGSALTTSARGILTAAILAEMTGLTEIRMTSSSGNIDVTTSNATLLARIVTNSTLNKGVADTSLQTGWAGTGAYLFTPLTSHCTSSFGTSLNSNIIHACGDATSFNWMPSGSNQRENWASGEIAATASLSMFVGAALVPLADLSLAKSVDNPTPVVGDDITYTITLTNSGGGVPTAVEITDILPAGLTYVSSNPSQGSANNSSGTVTWNAGTVAVGGTAPTLEIVATVTSAGTITNTAEVTDSDLGDPDSDPNDGAGDDFASVPITSTIPVVPRCTGVDLVTNGGFETPNYNAPAGSNQTPPASVPGWTTTDSSIEIWEHGFLGVPAHDGDQFAEVNAFIAGTLTNNSSIVQPRAELSVFWAHRARQGTDTASFTLSDNGGGSSSSGNFSATTAAWVEHSLTHIVSATGTVASVDFTAVSTGSGNISTGNFLDALKICQTYIVLTKTEGSHGDVDSSGGDSVGDTITYIFTVSNPAGNEKSLTSVQIVDDKIGTFTAIPVSGDDGDNVLEPGETWTVNADYTLVQADLDAGEVTNIAYAQGDTGDNVIRSDDETVTAVFIQAKDDRVSYPIDSSSSLTNVLNVLDDFGGGIDTLGGAQATTSTVSISPIGSLPTGITLNADGSVDVSSSTADGLHTFDYEICQLPAGTNCSTATVTLSIVDMGGTGLPANVQACTSPNATFDDSTSTLTAGTGSASYSYSVNSTSGYSGSSVTDGPSLIFQFDTNVTNPDSYEITYNVTPALGQDAVIRIYGGRGIPTGSSGNNSASEFTLNWTGGTGNATYYDPATPGTGMYFGTIDPGFDTNQRQIFGLDTTGGISNGGTFKTFNLLNSPTEWYVDLPRGATSVTISAAILNGSATSTDGIDWQLPVLGTGSDTSGHSANEWITLSTKICEVNPSLTVTKEASAPGFTAGNVQDAPVGTIVTYTYVITNDGDTIVDDVTVGDTDNSASPDVVPTHSSLTDNAPSGDSPDGNADAAIWGTLAPGDSVTFTGQYTITQADVDAL